MGLRRSYSERHLVHQHEQSQYNLPFNLCSQPKPISRDQSTSRLGQCLLRGLEFLQYDIQNHVGVCFRCHVPQGLIHPFNTTGGPLTCRHPDVLAPFFVGLWSLEHCRAAAQEHFTAQWPSFAAYKVWLLGRPITTVSNRTNLMDLFLWWAQL